MIEVVTTQPPEPLAQSAARLYTDTIATRSPDKRAVSRTYLSRMRNYTNLALVDESLSFLAAASFECPTQRRGHLVLLAVDPAHRRHEYGQTLVEHVERALLASGREVLEVFSLEQSVSFYEGVGFVSNAIKGHNEFKKLLTRPASDQVVGS